jgi:PHD-finger
LKKTQKYIANFDNFLGKLQEILYFFIHFIYVMFFSLIQIYQPGFYFQLRCENSWNKLEMSGLFAVFVSECIATRSEPLSCNVILLCFSCCQENVNYGPLVLCNGCKSAYHPNCHFPQLKNAIKPDTWKCGACTESYYDDNSLTNEIELNTLIQTQQPSTDDSPPINQEAIEKLRKWNTEDVFEYFVQYFPDIATVFREQEIDGSSILLMKRVDVLKGFKHLKLGPALNIYRHIVKLQNGGNDDPRLCWH